MQKSSSLTLKGVFVGAIAAACLTLGGCATTAESPSGSDRTLPGEEAPKPIVTPVVDRPKVGIRKIASQDFELGTYFGALLIQSKTTLGLLGVRGAYNISDNVFFEARYATSLGLGKNEFQSVGDYQSTNVSIGYHLVPGDFYISDSYTIPFVIYAIAGVGGVFVSEDGGSFTDESGNVVSNGKIKDNFAAYNFGAGIKILTFDRLAVRFEIQDQVFSRFGTDHNAEFSLGLAAYF